MTTALKRRRAPALKRAVTYLNALEFAFVEKAAKDGQCSISQALADIVDQQRIHELEWLEYLTGDDAGEMAVRP